MFVLVFACLCVPFLLPTMMIMGIDCTTLLQQSPNFSFWDLALPGIILEK